MDQNTNNQQEQTTFEGYAIVELMGHNIVAGHIREQTIAGAAMLRVDVPAVGNRPAYTKFYAPSAIYAITPTDEHTANVAAQNLAVMPISPWIIRPTSPRPALSMDEPGYDQEPDEDEDEQY